MVVLLAFVAPFGDALQDINPPAMFDPGPFGETTARIMISSVLGAALAFAFTFVNIVGRSIVNERIPREMQGRVLAAQTVLTNLASIPPILLTGLLADVIGVSPVFFLIAVRRRAAGDVLRGAKPRHAGADGVLDGDRHASHPTIAAPEDRVPSSPTAASCCSGSRSSSRSRRRTPSSSRCWCIVTKLTKGSTFTSVLVLSFVIPSVVFGIFSGVVVDLWSKRLLLIYTNVARMLLAICFLLARDHVALLILISIFFATASQFFGTTDAVTVPSVVPNDQLMAANSVFSMAVTGSQLLGMIFLAPILLPTVGAVVAVRHRDGDVRRLGHLRAS